MANELGDKSNTCAAELKLERASYTTTKVRRNETADKSSAILTNKILNRANKDARLTDDVLSLPCNAIKVKNTIKETEVLINYVLWSHHMILLRISPR